MCMASLSYAKEELGLDVAFNPNAGGLYFGAARGFLSLAKLDAEVFDSSAPTNFLTEFLKTTQTHQTASFGSNGRHTTKTTQINFTKDLRQETGYNTDSDTESESDEE